MDVMSSKQAFHLFGSCHLPDCLLGMILHKSMASTYAQAICLRSAWLFTGRKRRSSIPTCVSEAGEFFHLKRLISPPVFFLVSRLVSGDMKLGNQDVSGTLRDYIDGTVPFILSSHLFILLATCCKGQDIYAQGITGVCDAADLAVLPAGCVKPRALGMRAASSMCVQSRPVLEIMKLMMGMSLLTSAKTCIPGFDAKTDPKCQRAALHLLFN